MCQMFWKVKQKVKKINRLKANIKSVLEQLQQQVASYLELLDWFHKSIEGSLVTIIHPRRSMFEA